MDETSIKHWIGQLDRQRDNLIIAMSHYKREKVRIPTNTEKIEEEQIKLLREQIILVPIIEETETIDEFEEEKEGKQ